MHASTAPGGGENGRGADKVRQERRDIVLRVPVGTVITDAQTAT
jgi:GTPase involved in cell partitioning and DNA repair